MIYSLLASVSYNTEVGEKVATQMISSSDFIAAIAAFISLIAVFMSGWALHVQKKLNQVNLQAKYFEEIFKEYFLERIPRAARKIEFDVSGKLSGTYKDLNKVMMNMIKDCAYFAYAKNDFYQELSSMTKALEEKLVIQAGVVENDRNKRNAFVYSVHEDIQKIVEFINGNYMKC